MKMTARAQANWQRVYAMSFASMYPMYVAKAEKKGRTKAEVDQVIRWLTGYTQKGLDAQIAKKSSLRFSSTRRLLNPARPHNGDDLRVSRRGDRGTADAEHPLPRQAHRRTRQRPADGKGAAGARQSKQWQERLAGWREQVKT
ncbi:MAG: DUF2200 family protein [Hyphomonadaceae bacterium]